MNQKKYPWNHIADKLKKKEPEIRCVYAGPEMMQSSPPCAGVYAGPSPNDMPGPMEAVYAGPEYYNPDPNRPVAGEYISPEQFRSMQSSVIPNTSPEVFQMVYAAPMPMQNGSAGVSGAVLPTCGTGGRFCANCGNPLTEDARFCSECGTPCPKPENGNA